MSHIPSYHLCMEFNLKFFFEENERNFEKIYSFFCRLRWPFDEKTPLGYLCQTFFQCTGGFCLFSVAFLGNSFLLGSCRLFISFAMDLTSDFDGLNIERKSQRNSMKAKQNLRNIVKVSSNVHELS